MGEQGVCAIKPPYNRQGDPPPLHSDHPSRTVGHTARPHCQWHYLTGGAGGAGVLRTCDDAGGLPRRRPRAATARDDNVRVAVHAAQDTHGGEEEQQVLA